MVLLVSTELCSPHQGLLMHLWSASGAAGADGLIMPMSGRWDDWSLSLASSLGQADSGDGQRFQRVETARSLEAYLGSELA